VTPRAKLPSAISLAASALAVAVAALGPLASCADRAPRAATTPALAPAPATLPPPIAIAPRPPRPDPGPADPRDPLFGCSSDERAARRAEIESLAERVRAYAVDPTVTLAELQILLAKPCLRQAALAVPLPATTTRAALALVDQRGFFASLALLPEYTWRERAPHIALPPEIPPALPEPARKRLEPWICTDAQATTEEACLQGAAYQAKLTATAVELEQRGMALLHVHTVTAGLHILPAATCDGSAGYDQPPSSFQAWLTCVSRRAPRAVHYAPELALRAPERGWLLVRGRRGHYQYTDELHAYDLATGAAYIARRQDILHGGPEAQTQVASAVGRVPTDALRQLAFLLVSRPALVELRRVPYFAQLPGPFLPSVPDAPLPEIPVDLRRMPRTNQTRLDYVYLDGRLRETGSFHWPMTDDFDGLVIGLVGALEQNFAAGCAPARLPSTMQLRGKPGKASPQGTADYAALGRQLDELRGKACRDAK
jgi:hypothetical protein